MINEQMVTRNGQKGFLDDKGNFYPIADMPADDAKVTPSNTADQSGGLGAPDVQPRTSANANRDGSRPGGGMTDAQIKAAQDKANAERAAQQQRGSYSQPIPRGLGLGAKAGEPVIGIPVEPYKEPQTTPPAPKPNPNVVVSPTGEKTKFERRLPTTAELKAAQNARAAVLKKDKTKKAEAEYQAVKAGVAASKNPTTAVTGGVNPRQPIMNAYDLVLDYLLSEGHVDTVEEAHYVMLQMTSEHVQEVVEAYVVTNADKMGNTPAYQGYLKGKKNKLTGKPLYVAAPHLKGV